MKCDEMKEPRVLKTSGALKAAIVKEALRVRSTTTSIMLRVIISRAWILEVKVRNIVNDSSRMKAHRKATYHGVILGSAFRPRRTLECIDFGILSTPRP